MYCTNCGKHLTKKFIFCTRCGQKINTTSKLELSSNVGRKLRIPLFILWILTIFLFIISAGLIDPSRPNQIGKPPILPILFGVNFCIGVAAFLALIVTELMNIKVSKKSFHRFIFSLIIIFGLLYSSVVAIEGYARGNFNNILPLSIQKKDQQIVVNKVEGAKVTPSTGTNWQTEILNLINTERNAQNIKPLVEDSKLENSANGLLQEIVDTGNWSYEPSKGKDYKYFLNKSNYNFASAGVGMVQNFYSPTSAFQALISNKTNKENILNKDYVDIGIVFRDTGVEEIKSVVVIFFGTEQKQQVANNNNQVVSCGPGQFSGQYVKDKQSNCKNYVDCGLSNNVWTMMLKNECDKRQSETTTKNNLNPYPTLTNYPTCVVYYPILGISSTHYSIPPDLCQKWKEEAVSSSQMSTQAPTATPVPIPTVDNHAANSSCKYSASLWYNAQLQNSNNLFGDSSATQAMQQIALSTYNSMVSDCNNKYPI